MTAGRTIRARAALEGSWCRMWSECKAEALEVVGRRWVAWKETKTRSDMEVKLTGNLSPYIEKDPVPSPLIKSPPVYEQSQRSIHRDEYTCGPHPPTATLLADRNVKLGAHLDT